MQTLRKMFKHLLLTFVIGLIGLYYFSKFHFTPTYSGKIAVPEIAGSAHIFYDDFGIPHITADNRADLYTAFGYAVMQDRFFQIQMQKMIGSGRLSEWFGNKTLETDRAIRTIGIKHYTSEWYKKNKEHINPELLKDIQSWLSGVNACVKACPKPIELVLLKVTPELLTIEDVLAFSGIMSFSFTKSYFGDALMTKLSNGASLLQMEELSGAINFKSVANNVLNLKSITEVDPENFFPQMEGSQSWVIAPSKSASGFATLANDPHIAFSNPSVWYEAHLKSGDFELYGHFVPIIPFALIGHNLDKAWSLTMANSDELDLLIDTNDKHFTERVETIVVKNQPKVEIKIKDTVFGPVINNLLKTEQNAIMSWHYFRNDNYTIETFYDLAHAKALADFYAAIKKGRAPGLNILWADKSGNIAWKILGYFPKRSEPFWKIRTVSENDFNSLNTMKYAVDDKEIPQLENPKSGYILSANQKPPSKYDELKINGYWESSERYESLKSDLDSSEKIDLEFQKKMFSNNTFFGAAERLKKMLDQVKVDDETLKILSNWDGKAEMNNKAQAFYQIWIDETMKIVFKDHFNDTELEQFCSTTNYWKFATRIIDHPHSDWWKNQHQHTLQTAYDRTFIFFKSTYGGPEEWMWGKLHQIEFEHPLGKVKPLNYFFNLGPYPVAGGYMVPNAFRYKLCSHNFNVTSGASTRRLIDFKNPVESLGILPTGNSGVPFSRHYRDQVVLYLNGEFRPETLDWEKIKKFPDHVEFYK